MTSRIATLALSLLLGACTAERGAGLTDVEGSLSPLHAWFDAHAGHPRVILLLSPV